VSVSLFELTSAGALAERLAQRTLANAPRSRGLIERIRANGRDSAQGRGLDLTLSMKVSTELGDGVDGRCAQGSPAATHTSR
jgi:hypothetical protein